MNRLTAERVVCRGLLARGAIWLSTIRTTAMDLARTRVPCASVGAAAAAAAPRTSGQRPAAGGRIIHDAPVIHSSCVIDLDLSISHL